MFYWPGSLILKRRNRTIDFSICYRTFFYSCGVLYYVNTHYYNTQKILYRVIFLSALLTIKRRMASQTHNAESSVYTVYCCCVGTYYILLYRLSISRLKYIAVTTKTVYIFGIAIVLYNHCSYDYYY